MPDPHAPHDPHDPTENPFAGPPVDQDPQSPTPPTTPGPLPSPSGGPEDPGSSTARTWAWVAVAILLPVVVVLQQIQAHATPPAPATTQEITAPTAFDPFTSTAKPMLKLRQFTGEDMDAMLMGMLTGNLDDAAITPADRIRLAITQWELDQSDEAQQTLDDLALSTEPDDAIRPDIKIVSDLLNDQPPTGEERDNFIARHGWFAELALAHDDEARRDELLAGGGLMVAIFAILGLGVLLALVVGLVLLVLGLIRINTGKMPRRFTPPQPGGSVYLEMLPVFIAAFLFLQIISGVLLLLLGDSAGMAATLAAQWLLLGVIAWPVLRGVPWSRVKQDLGLVPPNGVLREIGAGALFYVASLPIYFFVSAIVAILFMIRQGFQSTPTGGGAPTPPPNPIVDLVGGASPLVLVLFALLATIWAPIVEELVFRGGVYRHLRSRIHWVGATLIVALFFGMMHQYSPLQIIPVMALGFIFGAMREWRGSIIASMTAHFIHNFTVFTILTLVLGVALD
jgi:membrane protease YdiL (CAAX protease family)